MSSTIIHTMLNPILT